MASARPAFSAAPVRELVNCRPSRSLKMVAFQQDKFDTRQPVAVRSLGLAGLTLRRLFAAPAFGVQPFGINRVDRDQPLHDNLRPLEGQLDILVLAAGACVAPNGDAVAGKVV